jgi:hypothetical protein
MMVLSEKALMALGEDSEADKPCISGLVIFSPGVKRSRPEANPRQLLLFCRSICNMGEISHQNKILLTLLLMFTKRS